MLLVVDSGSTKSDWVLLNGDQQINFSTMGLNPYFHDEATVIDAVKGNKDLFTYSSDVQKIYFYGAGCSAPHLTAIIQRGLETVFPNATVKVDHDLTACAYATYTGVPSIACIIGTGSNSCHFDGKTLSEEVPALGYILGDEGSGSYFGKQLLSLFLYKRLPKHLHEAFEAYAHLNKNIIVENVYMKPNANVYLASMTRFLVEQAEDAFVKNMVYEGFKRFVDIHITCFKDHQSVPVHFVGSIAHLFRAELEQACADYGVHVGNIIQKPIDGLVNYHQHYLVQS